MTIDPPDVHDRESAIAFVLWCVETVGLGYHPDTPFSEYVDRDGLPTFIPADASRLEELADRACTFCDPYEVGEREFQNLLGQDGSKPQSF